MKPLVSIIMPFYNAEPFIVNAIESVLKQDYKNLEVICINDGSTDATAGLLSSYKQKDNRIIIIENERNLGLISSLNKALPLAKGEFFARMDADDEMPSNRISKQVLFLETNKEIQIVSSGYTYFEKNGIQLQYVPPVATEQGALKYLSLFVTVLAHAAICARRSLITSHVFVYDKNYIHTEDFELFSRLAWNGIKLASINESLYNVRLHPASVSQVYYKQQIISNINVFKRNLSSYLNDHTHYDEIVLKTALCKVDCILQMNQVYKAFDILNKITKKAVEDIALSETEREQLKHFVKVHKLNIIIQANKFRFKNKGKGNIVFLLRSMATLGITQVIGLIKKLFR